jgi:hypothetical protein
MGLCTTGLLTVLQSKQRGIRRCLPVYKRSQFTWSFLKYGLSNTGCHCMTTPWHFSDACTSETPHGTVVLPCLLFSPNFLHCDFYLFPYIKGRHFKDSAEAHVALKTVLQEVTCVGLQKYFEQVCAHWQKYVVLKRQYFEASCI